MSGPELDDAVIKATQQSLGKFIKKPPLTEKLLTKPPFRYLMDVFNSFIKETGCFEGLYTPDEQLFENISDRQDKIRFLQKMIDVTKLTTKLDLKVRTSKIVAGHEPKLTNELLQAMASVAEKKLDWEDALEQVLIGDAGNKPKESKQKEVKGTSKQISPTMKENRRISPQEKKLRKVTDQAMRTTPTEREKARKKTETETKIKSSRQNSKQKTPSPVKPTGKLKQQTSSESEIKSMSPAPAIPASIKQTPTPTKQNPAPIKQTPAPTKQKPAEPTAAANTEQRTVPKPTSSATEEPTKQSIPSPTKAVELVANPEPESRKSSGRSRRSSGSQRQVATAADPLPSIENSEQSITTIPTTDSNNNSKQNSNNANNINNTNNSSNTNNNNTGNSNNINSEIKRDREGTFTRENSKESNSSVTRPRTSLRPPSARPASARPGAPRRRNVEIVLQPNDQIKMSGINVKLETFGDFDDDGENLVIIEDANAHDIAAGATETALEPDAHQGRLVQQILETQKELVQQPNSDAVNDEQQKSQAQNVRQSSARQVNDLRDVIQTLTKSVNPLGKLMDFIPEDIDAMQLELTMWRETYTQSAAELKRERSLTASATEPMKQQLLTIEASIDEYKELVDESRQKILQNNERILKMLMEQ